jgi:hypothetical protein
MTSPWRPLALAAALNVIVAVGVATAQTVIVTNAPPGSTVELALDAATVASATADPAGQARLALDLSRHAGRPDMDVRIYVDVCGPLRRVVVVEGGVQPPPPADTCVRKDIVGLFIVRQVTTLVVDVTEPRPAVWISQGPAPAEWLRRAQEQVASARVQRRLPTGLELFGGGGLVKVSDVVAQACGDVAACKGKSSRPAYAFGGAYWFTTFLAAEVSYMKPADVKVTGSGDTYHFSSVLDARLVTVVGKVGASVGPVRLYGQAGVNHHQATSSTTNTIDDTTVTIDGVDQIVKGGTQTFEFKTAGWNWVLGGGAEVWANKKVAVYAEVGRAKLRGADQAGGEGRIDYGATSLVVGLRFHLGR